MANKLHHKYARTHEACVCACRLHCDEGSSYLLVADSDNDRVKLLGCSPLEYIGDVLRPADGLRGPYRLSVDEHQKLLAVGCVDGRVFVFELRHLLPDSVAADS